MRPTVQELNKFVLSNRHPIARSQPPQQLQHIPAREGNAAGSRRISRARQMHEDCAAPSDTSRPVVVAEHHDNVVKCIFPPKPLMAAGEGKFDRSVIVAVGRIVAPAVIWPDRAGLQARHGTAHSVGAVEDGTDRPLSERCNAIALAQFRAASTPSDRAGKAKTAQTKLALGAPAG